MKRGIFPGSFDPFTKGHESLVRQALEIFDEIVIGIGVNSKKTYLFSLEKRKMHIESLFDKNVIVDVYEGLTVEFCKKNDICTIIRGLRDTKDFEYEKSIAHLNKQLASIQTVFYITEPEFSSINSSIVREIYTNGGDISKFVTNSTLLV